MKNDDDFVFWLIISLFWLTALLIGAWVGISFVFQLMHT